MTGESRGGELSLVVRLFTMMFLQFFIWGAWFVTVGNFMKTHGMEADIPWAYSVGPIAAIISPFFLGMVADRFFATERILGLMHILGAAVMLALPGISGNPALFKGALMLYALFYMPTLGLTNTLAFHNIANQEKEFPIIRVGGTIGWIVANIIVSKVLQADFEATQFYVAGAASAALGLYSFTLPHTPPPAAGQQTTARDILGLDSLALLKQPSFAVFMFSSFLICIPLAAYYSYASVFVGESGFQNPAFNMSFGQMSEIFFMLIMPVCFAVLGVKWMLLVGMLAWVVRYGLFAAAAPDQVQWMILAGIILHGICYDFFFVTGQVYVDKKAPKAIRGQAQGFLVLVTQGVGMLIGAQAIGAIVSHYTTSTTTAAGAAVAVKNWQAIWLIPCIAAGIVMVLFGILFRDDTRATQQELAQAEMEVVGA